MDTTTNTLLLNPTLAELVGLNESIVLQQLYYWQKKYDSTKWIYNTYEDWKKQFKWWSINTIRRTFKSLEEQGFIKSKRAKYCKFYKLCLEKVKKFFSDPDCPNWSPRLPKMSSLYTETTTKTSNNNNSLSKSLSHLLNSHQITCTKSGKKTKKEREKLKNIVKESPVTTPQQESNQQHKSQNEDISAKLVESWNDIFKNSEDPIKAYNNRRLASKLVKLYEEEFNNNLEEWKAYARKIASNEFLTGKKKRGFKATFPWLLKKDTINTILNGGYGVSNKTEHLIQDTIPQEMTKIWYSSISPQEGLPKLTQARIKKLAEVFKCHFESNMDKWKKFVSLVANCNFLTGGVTDFKASIWWAINDDTLLKIQEGNYHSKDEWSVVTAKPKEKISLKDLEYNEDIDPKWKKVLQCAINVFEESTYISWISKLEFKKESDNVIYLQVPSKFIRDEIEGAYSRKLFGIAGNYFKGLKKMKILSLNEKLSDALKQQQNKEITKKVVDKEFPEWERNLTRQQMQEIIPYYKELDLKTRTIMLKDHFKDKIIIPELTKQGKIERIDREISTKLVFNAAI